jgi:hypothetical protein
MPNGHAAKIVSVRNPHGVSLLVVTVVIFSLSVILAPAYRVVDLTIGHSMFGLQVADSDSARQAGLSGRKSLAAHAGMLFSYPSSAVRCYWMKDMNFSLDIIWLNTLKRIEYIQTDASPKSYPQQYCPHQPARYVIELNAGTAQSVGLHNGQLLHF